MKILQICTVKSQLWMTLLTFVMCLSLSCVACKKRCKFKRTVLRQVSFIPCRNIWWWFEIFNVCKNMISRQKLFNVLLEITNHFVYKKSCYNIRNVFLMFNYNKNLQEHGSVFIIPLKLGVSHHLCDYSKNKLNSWIR